MKTSYLCVVVLAALVGFSAATVHFKEDFDSTWESRWVESSWKEDTKEKGFFLHTAGKWYGEEERDMGIQTTEDSRFYAISHKFEKPFSNKGKPLVFQYTVKFEQQIDCGGGYIKLLNGDFDQKKFSGDTAYHVMFGPDICGSNRIHFIITNREKNHLWEKTVPAHQDVFSHIYRFVLNPDQTYKVFADDEEKGSGSLLDDWKMIPPKQIPDPEAKKPDDWVDEAEIDDPEDKKPEDWDSTPEMIPDPEAKKPEDWDEEEDGEWKAPQIKNPEFKGEWKPKKIPNPEYKGAWEAPKIDNPEHFEDNELYAFPEITGVGIEVWQVKSGTLFDNIFVGDSIEEADEHKKKTWEAMKDGEKAAHDEAKKAEAPPADDKKEDAKAEAADKEDDEDKKEEL